MVGKALMPVGIISERKPFFFKQKRRILYAALLELQPDTVKELFRQKDVVKAFPDALIII